MKIVAMFSHALNIDVKRVCNARSGSFSLNVNGQKYSSAARPEQPSSSGI